jgi:predicted DNA binding CopG/RHH family protein
MDMDIDDGEVTDDEPPATAENKDIEADIAAAKARLLARLEENQQEEEQEPSGEADADDLQQNEASGGDGTTFDEARARVNMRATLNMILTVAGEFYGQRDLLEFRDPFPAL